VFYGPVVHTIVSAKGAKINESRPEPASSPADTDEAVGDDVVLASPGRIEALSDTLDVGAGIDGVIQAIYVKEGQTVAAGQRLAELDCRELRSALPVSKSEAESLSQVRARLVAGSRIEERQAAAQRTARALAILAHAKAQLDRQRQLADAQAVSRVVLDEARRDAEVAESEYQLALRAEALTNAPPLAEELAKAEADLEAANRRFSLGEEKLAKCVIRAPQAGTILRIILHPGESFALVSPRPVLSMADLTGRRVRAEVDEHDIGKVHEGQLLSITSDAYAGKRFLGHVTRIASLMGRKSVITGDPADKTDRDVLEIIAQLEASAVALPVGLRTTVHFRP
jgi:multidrug resistance efflux pump